MTEGIILLHGILRTAKCMNGLAKFLESNKFKVLNLNYPSSKYDIASIATSLNATINEFANQVTKIHFVGYSMGGLIIRAYLNLHRPDNLGRVVMLGTPNQGSEIADFLKDFFLYKKLYGPAGQQLITDQMSFKEIFGAINYELGVIAGVSPYYMVANKIIGRESDGRVSVVSTQINGMQDHVIIKSGHTLLPANKQAWQLTLNFLSKGSFK